MHNAIGIAPRSTPPDDRRRRSETDARCALLLLLLAFVPYLNSLWNGFVYDDQAQIVVNPYVHNFRYLGHIFGGSVWTFEGAQGISNYYRPLMTLAYLICYKLFGPVPFGFHLLNVVLHAAVVLLLFFVTRALFDDTALALVAAGLFALHPIHTESVAWIAGITDLELSFFFLLAFLLYLRLPDAEARGWGGRAQIALLAAFVAALLSKEPALLLPAVAVAYEHFYRDDRRATAAAGKLRRYAPLCVTAAAYIPFRHLVLGSFAPAEYRATLGWHLVAQNAVALTGAYLWKLLWPFHLVAFYEFHPVSRLSDPRFLGGLAALALCLALFLWLWRRDRVTSFGFVWMAATLAPVLDARVMPAQVFAERYLYLPSVGFCWLVARAAMWAWRAPAKRRSLAGSAAASPQAERPGWQPVAAHAALAAALAVVAVSYGVRTVTRNVAWRTDSGLYWSVLAGQPNLQLMRTDVGVLDWERGDKAGAEREWTAALTGSHPPYSATLNDMGLVRTSQRRYPEAIAFFERAIAINARFMDPHLNLATVYDQQGRLADADREYRKAVTLMPLSTDAHNTYGRFLLAHARVAEALREFEQSAAADDNPAAEDYLGAIWLQQGDLQRAARADRAALKLFPYDSKACFGLAEIAERTGHPDQALKEYRAGLYTDPRNVTALAAVQRLEALPTANPASSRLK